MKKVLVINEVLTSVPSTCCNFFKKVDQLKAKKSEKKYLETTLSNKLNEVSENGYEYEDNKVLPYKIYVDNKIYQIKIDRGEYLDVIGHHGVFRFASSNRKEQYQLYFGPIIDAEDLSIFGCSGIGCGSVGCDRSFGKIGCGEIGCGKIGCKGDAPKEYKQYLNFMNNDKNTEKVQKLNKYFGLRKIFNRNTDDYIYETEEGITELSELVKNNKERIIQIFNQEITSFFEKGFGFKKIIDMPSNNDLYTQAILLSNLSTTQVSIAETMSDNAERKNLYLSRFDIWYYSKISNPKTLIEDKNIKQLEKIYEEDFNEQEEERIRNQHLYENFIGKVPVTIAVRKHRHFRALIEFFLGKEYSFYTYFIDAVKKE